MERDELVRRLHDLGFSPYTTVEEALEKTTDRVLADMVDLYRTWHGLEDGDSILQRHLDAPRFCSLPDRMQLGAQICRWPQADKVVRFTIIGILPNVSREQWRQAAELACGRWNRVCGIRLTWTDDANAAHITMDARRIDRAGQVLAESELPCGSAPRRCRQWYDTSEAWSLTDGGSGMAIYLAAVICHEVGHAIGLEHTNDGGLMDPVYKPGLSAPRGGQELQGVVQRYGPAVAAPPPPPAGPAGLTIHVAPDGTPTIDGYRVTKLAG